MFGIGIWELVIIFVLLGVPAIVVFVLLVVFFVSKQGQSLSSSSHAALEAENRQLREENARLRKARD